MRKYFILFALLTAGSQKFYSQNSTIDSIIISQSDEAVKSKLKKFKNGGIEKTLNLGTNTPDDVVNSAVKYLYIPHCMGGNGKTTKSKKGKPCIDCSGLLYTTFSDLGVDPGVHNSQEMARYGKIFNDTNKIQKGDILFFVKSYKPGNPEIVITHSAIALGDGRMIHASASNGVEIIPINTSYWSTRFIFATRVF